MKGYTTWSTESSEDSASYSGNFNHGDYNINLSLSGTLLNDYGWNLVGNPYPSYIDWDLVGIPQNMDAAIYIWDPDISSYRYYITGGGVLNTCSQYIAPGQGFFVRCNNAAGAILGINNAVRTNTGNSFYKKVDSDKEQNQLLLSVEGMDKDVSQGVSLHWQASRLFDSKLDIYRLGSNKDEALQFYSKLLDEEYCLNSINNDDFPIEIPLYFEYGLSGNFSFSALNIKQFDAGISVMLKDLNTNQTINLRTQSEYNFTHQSDNNGRRFMLKLDINTAVSSLNKEKDYMVWGSHNKINIEFIHQQNASVSVYDVLGKKVFSENYSQKNLIIIPVDLNRGLYIVNIKTNKNKCSEKIIL